MDTKQLTVFTGCLIHDDKVLLVQRNEEGYSSAHLKWELPGGKVEQNETPEQCVEREILEETGIKVTVKQLLPKVFLNNWVYSWGTQQTFIFCFLCELISDHDVTNNDHKVADVKWVRLSDLNQYDTLPGVKEAIILATKKQLN